jgi:winged helix-turn helix protein
MERLPMSRPELHRLEVLTRLQAGALDQIQAARELGLSDRQVRRLLRRFACDGAAGLIHASRGRPSRRHLDPDLVNEALSLVAQHYADFGPTFANEKLRELHGLQLGTESLRQAMIAAHLWKPKRTRRQRLHPPRERRPHFGELLQLDGSPHDWFEGRAPRCSLLVIIDDATSRLTGLHFAPAETTWAYFALLRQSIGRYGRPLALYSDRHAIFRAPNGLHTSAQTQLGRALEELDVELICANSPQAKGRVERANNTLQRRLVREMRLRNISSIEDANAYLPHFIQAHNQRFAHAPALEQDVHRSASTFELDAILAVRYERVLSKDCTVQVQRDVYLVDDPAARRGMRVTVIEQANRGFQLRHNDIRLHCRRLRSLTEQGQIRDAKSLNEHLDRRQRAPMPQMARIIPANHPWRSFRLPGSPPPT